MFVHPEVRAFDKSHESEALEWYMEVSLPEGDSGK